MGQMAWLMTRSTASRRKGQSWAPPSGHPQAQALCRLPLRSPPSFPQHHPEIEASTQGFWEAPAPVLCHTDEEP